MRFSELLLVASALAVVMPVARAVEQGVAIGPTYPIGEESALDTIMRRLKEKERTGELRRIREHAIKRSIDAIKNPTPVGALTTVLDRSQRLIDPTVTYTKAITTDEGRIVVPAGAKINPLLMTSLTKRLVFFDGRDPAQLDAVHKMVVQYSSKVKPILVAGSWFDTSKAWKTQVYYDQHGKLSQRFGIRAVPTVISQQGAMLLVEEIPAEALQ